MNAFPIALLLSVVCLFQAELLLAKAEVKASEKTFEDETTKVDHPVAKASSTKNSIKKIPEVIETQPSFSQRILARLKAWTDAAKVKLGVAKTSIATKSAATLAKTKAAFVAHPDAVKGSILATGAGATAAIITNGVLANKPASAPPKKTKTNVSPKPSQASGVTQTPQTVVSRVPQTASTASVFEEANPTAGTVIPEANALSHPILTRLVIPTEKRHHPRSSATLTKFNKEFGKAAPTAEIADPSKATPSADVATSGEPAHLPQTVSEPKQQPQPAESVTHHAHVAQTPPLPTEPPSSGTKLQPQQEEARHGSVAPDGDADASNQEKNEVVITQDVPTSQTGDALPSGADTAPLKRTFHGRRNSFNEKRLGGWTGDLENSKDMVSKGINLFLTPLKALTGAKSYKTAPVGDHSKPHFSYDHSLHTEFYKSVITLDMNLDDSQWTQDPGINPDKYTEFETIYHSSSGADLFNAAVGFLSSKISESNWDSVLKNETYFKAASKLFEMASKKEHSEAPRMLAFLVEQRALIKKEWFDQATKELFVKNMRDAASKGSVLAQLHLMHYYYEARDGSNSGKQNYGIPKNEENAREYFRHLTLTFLPMAKKSENEQSNYEQFCIKQVLSYAPILRAVGKDTSDWFAGWYKLIPDEETETGGSGE